MEMERNGDGRQVQGTFASVTLMKNMARSGAERATVMDSLESIFS